MANSRTTGRTIECGPLMVPVLERNWTAIRGLPYRKTYRLTPGQSWWNAEITDKQSETLTATLNGAVPVGSLIAAELDGPETEWVAFTELWGRKPVLMSADLVCLPIEGDRAELLAFFRSLNAGSLSGLPDVIGRRADGSIILREAKTPLTKDRLQPNQKRFIARVAEALPGRVDAAIVEWGSVTAS